MCPSPSCFVAFLLFIFTVHCILFVGIMDNNRRYRYAVIEFLFEEELYVSAAPFKWINEGNNTCLWPPKKAKERKEIVNNSDPGSDWSTIRDIRILGKFATYSEAIFNEKKKINSSDSEVEDPGQRRRKILRNRKYRDDSLSPIPQLADEESSSGISAGSGHTRKEAEQIFSCSLEEVPEISEPTKSAHLKNQAAKPQTPLQIEDIPIIFQEANISENDISSDLKKIISMLEDIQTGQDLLTERIKELEAYAFSAVKTNKLPEIDAFLGCFPLNSIIEIQESEEKLSTNEELQEKLFTFLQYLGGHDPKNCINRCLEKTFSNYVGQFCCWTGKRGNQKVADLKIIQIIKKSVRVSFPVTDDFFEHQVMNWFQQAKTRYLRQEKRTLPDEEK